jgi:hypothetical protein
LEIEDCRVQIAGNDLTRHKGRRITEREGKIGSMERIGINGKWKLRNVEDCSERQKCAACTTALRPTSSVPFFGYDLNGHYAHKRRPNYYKTKCN